MEDKVIKILKRYSMDESHFENLNYNSNLKNDLAVNSGRIIDIVLDMEEEFNISIDEKKIQNIKTYGEMIDVLKEYL